MGARVTRVFRNYNIENRVHREISKEKPTAAPRHPVSVPPTDRSSEVADVVTQKNDRMLALLRSVYVESTDPAPAAPEASKAVTVGTEVDRRPTKVSFSGSLHGLAALEDIPKGKLTIIEAMKALGNHHNQPQTWTPDKIAQEYSLDLKDTKALLEFFIPFKLELVSPKTEGAKQIKAS